MCNEGSRINPLRLYYARAYRHTRLARFTRNPPSPFSERAKAVKVSSCSASRGRRLNAVSGVNSILIWQQKGRPFGLLKNKIVKYFLFSTGVGQKHGLPARLKRFALLCISSSLRLPFLSHCEQSASSSNCATPAYYFVPYYFIRKTASCQPYFFMIK